MRCMHADSRRSSLVPVSGSQVAMLKFRSTGARALPAGVREPGGRVRRLPAAAAGPDQADRAPAGAAHMMLFRGRSETPKNRPRTACTAWPREDAFVTGVAHPLMTTASLPGGVLPAQALRGSACSTSVHWCAQVKRVEERLAGRTMHLVLQVSPCAASACLAHSIRADSDPVRPADRARAGDPPFRKRFVTFRELDRIFGGTLLSSWAHVLEASCSLPLHFWVRFSICATYEPPAFVRCARGDGLHKSLGTCGEPGMVIGDADPCKLC